MTPARRIRLAIEVITIFILAPLAMYHAVYIERIPLFALFPFIFAALVAILLFEPGRDWRRSLVTLPSKAETLQILLAFAVFGSAIAIFTYVRYPDLFLTFPRNAPQLWLLVMVFYPLISVTTQELVYRVLFFHRYAPLFGGWTWGAIAVNAVLFATMHGILFAYRSTPFHWEAIAISLAGGFIFARRFVRTRSYAAVVLEHALYGNLIFTIGLGRFFFTGVSSFN
jgi:hypothetical protein